MSVMKDGATLNLLVNRPSETLRVQATNNLRNAILEGRFQPGERLVERKLCELLGVSRTLVREALRQLEAENWVANEPNRGPAVARVSAKEARDIYEIRIALEGLATQLFVERATGQDMKALEESCRLMKKAVLNGDMVAQRACVESFYDALLRGTGNDLLWTQLTSQRARLTQLRSLSLSQPNRPQASLLEKQELLEALQARDARRARKISEIHLRSAAEAAARALTADGPADTQAASAPGGAAKKPARLNAAR